MEDVTACVSKVINIGKKEVTNNLKFIWSLPERVVYFKYKL